jgi:translocator protein
MFKEINWITLLACVALPVVIGSLSGLANVESINGWYATLTKPSFSPPNYLFGPVWTLLYVLMGISLYIILQSPKTEMRDTALILFVVQLVLNFSWSFIFFYFQSPFAALIVILVMWVSILTMIVYFFRISHPAAYLQAPYLLWVSFATVLNGAIWYLNR